MFDNYSTPEKFMEENGYHIEGTWYPRVTKIVSIKSKPALYWVYGEAGSYKAREGRPGEDQARAHGPMRRTRLGRAEGRRRAPGVPLLAGGLRGVPRREEALGMGEQRMAEEGGVHTLKMVKPERIAVRA